MRILFIGDIVAGAGRKAVNQVLPGIIKEHNIEYVIANCENLSHGRGISPETINEMQTAGVNFFTGGDHLFWQKDTEDFIDNLPVIRPANYPSAVAGIGHKLIDLGSKGNLLIINLMGRVSFNQTTSFLEDPFTKADEILKFYEGSNVTYTVIDMHAEATSEKMAFGFYMDGRVDAIVGTHTHVPTCDNMLLPKGTMYVSDIGMTGNIDSVLGVKKEIIIRLQLTAMNQKFEWETTGRKAFRSVILDTEAKKIDRLDMII